MIKALGTALFREEGPARFGLQDRGQSPGGVVDRFSYEIAQRLLEADAPRCYSLIFGRTLQLQEDAYLFITGAKYRFIRCNGIEVPMNVVFKATKDSVLEFENKMLGFRTYIYTLPLREASSDLSGRERGRYSRIFSWVAEDQSIRVLPGPESAVMLSNMRELEGPWHVGRKSNEMGLRLERDTFVPPENAGSMVSQPVVDGTVQMTPAGPLVLLRERQTIGGYPRVAVVTSADIDLLAQFGPGDSIAFSVIDFDDACRAYQAKRECLAAIGNVAD